MGCEALVRAELHLPHVLFYTGLSTAPVPLQPTPPAVSLEISTLPQT